MEKLDSLTQEAHEDYKEISQERFCTEFRDFFFKKTLKELLPQSEDDPQIERKIRSKVSIMQAYVTLDMLGLDK